MPILKALGLGSLGVGAIIAVVLVVWAISALFWGTILGLGLWNLLLHSAFHAGTLNFVQSLGVGAVASLVLG